MRWAEAHFEPGRKYPSEVNDERTLAAAELYRLAGDAEWHELFLATTVFRDPKADLCVWQHHDQREAAWVYLRTDRPGMDEAVKRNCLAALRREADDRAASCQRTSFRYAKYEWVPCAWGAFTAPDAVSLIRAHALTGEEKYLRAAVLACQLGAGANPVNVCYTTGLGHKSPQNPLHLDSRNTHQPPPPGLTVFGPMDVVTNKDDWQEKLVAPFCFPDVVQWPTLEAYYDIFWNPMVSEFTVQGPMAPNAYVWGYLAARGTH
jgi:endoglucanase